MASRPSPPQPSWLGRVASGTRRTVTGEVLAARNGIKVLNRYGNLTAVGVAARQGFAKAQDEGKSGREAAVVAAKDVALPLGILAMPTFARLAGHGAKSAFDASARRLDVLKSNRRLSAANRLKVEQAAHRASNAAKVVGVTLQGVSFGAALVRPAMTALAGWRGAAEDDNKLRGAMRGVLRSFDPSAIVLEKGTVETMFDRTFGMASGSTASNRRARLDGSKPVMEARRSIPTTPVRGDTFERHYTKGPKAGTTEIVHRRSI